MRLPADFGKKNRGREAGDPTRAAHPFLVLNLLVLNFRMRLFSWAAGCWAKKCVGKKMGVRGREGGAVQGRRRGLIHARQAPLLAPPLGKA